MSYSIFFLLPIPDCLKSKTCVFQEEKKPRTTIELDSVCSQKKVSIQPSASLFQRSCAIQVAFALAFRRKAKQLASWVGTSLFSYELLTYYHTL